METNGHSWAYKLLICGMLTFPQTSPPVEETPLSTPNLP